MKKLIPVFLFLAFPVFADCVDDFALRDELTKLYQGEKFQCRETESAPSFKTIIEAPEGTYKDEQVFEAKTECVKETGPFSDRGRVFSYSVKLRYIPAVIGPCFSIKKIELVKNRVGR